MQLWWALMKQIRLSFFCPLTTRRRGIAVPKNSLSTEYMAPVSKKKAMNHPDTMIFTQGSLSEMAVVGSREPRSLQSSMSRPRRSAGGQSIFDGLMTGSAWRQLTDQCRPWRHNKNGPRTHGEASPDPVSFLTTFGAGTQWSSSPRDSLWGHLDGLSQHLVILFIAFSSLSWYTLMTRARTSAYGVRGPLSKCLSLVLMLGTLWKSKEVIRHCLPHVFQGLGWHILGGSLWSILGTETDFLVCPEWFPEDFHSLLAYGQIYGDPAGSKFYSDFYLKCPLWYYNPIGGHG